VTRLELEIDEEDLEKVRDLLDENYTLRLVIANHWPKVKIVNDGKREKVRALSDRSSG
jgi:hypothetical protein